MECGEMKNLSGILKGSHTNGITRNHYVCPLMSAGATPRSQTASSTHATPRGNRGPFRSNGSGCGFGNEEFGGLLPPWELRGNERALSPRTRQSPRVGRRLMIASRDKESLLEEIIELKKALVEQSDIMRVKSAQSNRIGCQNRKLEMDLEDLETSFQLEGPRTGSPQRLRGKLQGLKWVNGTSGTGLQMTVDELQDTCDAQREELLRLRRDIRVTRTREIEVERDVFAGEIRRLQKVLRRMQCLQNRMNCENRDLGRLKNKYQKLEIANLRLESCMTAKAVRPQSQPGVSRKLVHHGHDCHQMHSERSQLHECRPEQQKPRL